MTQSDRQTSDFAGCATWIVENGAFALGMALMFSKTVDLMTAFAPRTIFGYTGIETFYGLAVGVLIEGALFVMKLTLPRAKNAADWLWNVLVVIAPFLISALAQVFDSFLVRDTLSEQPEAVRLFITWFVPSIPSVIMALLIGKSIFSSIPAEIMPVGAPRLPQVRNETAGPKWSIHLPDFLKRRGWQKITPEQTVAKAEAPAPGPTLAAPESTKRPPQLGHPFRHNRRG